MMLRTIQSRAAGRVHTGVPGRPRYAVARRGGRLRPVHSVRLTIMGGAPCAWWRRLTDDREFVGAKLLLLAALIALSAVLQGGV